MRSLVALLVFAAAPLSTKIDSYVAPYVKFHAFSGVILVAHKDDVVFQKAYGMANYEFNVPMTTDTRFRIASITKRFTGIIVNTLVEQKKLGLSDPLS